MAVPSVPTAAGRIRHRIVAETKQRTNEKEREQEYGT